MGPKPWYQIWWSNIRQFLCPRHHWLWTEKQPWPMCMRCGKKAKGELINRLWGGPSPYASRSEAATETDHG